MKKIYINITMIYIERNSRYYEHPLNERGETLSKLISHDFGCICWWDVKKGAKEELFYTHENIKHFHIRKKYIDGEWASKENFGKFSDDWRGGEREIEISMLWRNCPSELQWALVSSYFFSKKVISFEINLLSLRGSGCWVG